MPRDDLIRYRRGTAAEWTDVNPVLADSEPGHETDTGKVKIGDGVTPWVALQYLGGLLLGTQVSDLSVQVDLGASADGAAVAFDPTVTGVGAADVEVGTDPTVVALTLPAGLYRADLRLGVTVGPDHGGLAPGLRLTVDGSQAMTTSDSVESVASDFLLVEFSTVVAVADGEPVVVEAFGDLSSFEDPSSIDSTLGLIPLLR